MEAMAHDSGRFTLAYLLNSRQKIPRIGRAGQLLTGELGSLLWMWYLGQADWLEESWNMLLHSLSLGSGKIWEFFSTCRYLKRIETKTNLSTNQNFGLNMNQNYGLFFWFMTTSYRCHCRWCLLQAMSPYRVVGDMSNVRVSIAWFSITKDNWIGCI